MLRAVAQEWSSLHKNVDYFPSYEIVQNSERDLTWIEDLRHVRGQAVGHIMNLFLQHYLECEGAPSRNAQPQRVAAPALTPSAGL